ncbi:MAG TPA: hypothetical protein VM283_00190, partial [Armatimonadota bacterium]|nr:hypothetical protein [Armatimonadota bacterium]
RAVPAARADLPELWVERFGEVPGGFVTVGNPTDDTARATVSFDRSRCGAVALATDAGYAVPVRVEGGSARAQVELPARTPLAWQIVASLDPPPPDGTAITASVSGEVTRIDLNCPRACQATLTVALPDEHAFDSLLVGGAEAAAETLGAVVRARVSLPEGQSSVELRHSPLYRIAPEASDFPFFDGEKCASAIVLREGAGEAEQAAAEHLSRYFQYWLANRAELNSRYDLLWQKARDEQQIPIVQGGEAQPAGNLVLIGAPELPATTTLTPLEPPDPPVRGSVQVVAATDGRRVLTVRAGSPDHLDATLRALLAALDERYPF